MYLIAYEHTYMYFQSLIHHAVDTVTLPYIQGTKTVLLVGDGVTVAVTSLSVATVAAPLVSVMGMA